jgi:hypothetical protein
VKGCHTIERFVCVDGWPRYLCIYDWDTLDVLESDAYKAVHATKSPWTSRVLARSRGFIRIQANQIHPGRATYGQSGKPARVVMGRLSGDAKQEKALIVAHEKYFANARNVLQWRLSRTDGAEGEYWLCVEYSANVDVGLSGLTLPNGAYDIVNTYAPYWRNP